MNSLTSSGLRNSFILGIISGTFKAPEEYEKGALIDERTTVFTLAALLFSFFTPIEKAEIKKRYETKVVLPPHRSAFMLNDGAYAVLKKALSRNKEDRYASLSIFHEAWLKALENE